jgi:hypothetical protein
MADFRTWTHENLVKFAEEANAKMIQQQEYNEQLQRSLKDSQTRYEKLSQIYKGVTWDIATKSF